ncbi:MAG: MFS transporter [Candidatus Omnitrophica bacterium]|nr:MFS transporter [Candidatus Omnitrophota bacterium]
MKKATFLILCLEGAVLSFNVAASAALVPAIAGDFAVSQFRAGMLVWLYMLPYGVAALFYGPLVRVLDARRVELFCFFLFSLSNLLAGLSRNIQVLFAARLFMGVFGASVIPLVLILIGSRSQEEGRGKLVGVFFSATFVASLLGLFLSGFVSWRLIYIIPAIAGFALLVVMYFFLPRFEPEAAVLRFDYGRVLREKRVFRIFAYIFLISLLYHGIQQWLAVYFSVRFGLSQFFISMLITLTSLSGVFGEVIGGHLSDLLGRRHTVNMGIALMIASVFLLALGTPVFLLALLMVAWGLGWTFNHAGLSTMLTDLPRGSLNEAASLNSGVRFVSGGLGVALAGAVMQKGFVLGLTVFGAGLAVLCATNRSFLFFNIGEAK